jgi:hypothetical protein
MNHLELNLLILNFLKNFTIIKNPQVLKFKKNSPHVFIGFTRATIIY